MRLDEYYNFEDELTTFVSINSQHILLHNHGKRLHINESTSLPPSCLLLLATTSSHKSIQVGVQSKAPDQFLTTLGHTLARAVGDTNAAAQDAALDALLAYISVTDESGAQRYVGPSHLCKVLATNQ